MEKSKRKVAADHTGSWMLLTELVYRRFGDYVSLPKLEMISTRFVYSFKAGSPSQAVRQMRLGKVWNPAFLAGDCTDSSGRRRNEER